MYLTVTRGRTIVWETKKERCLLSAFCLSACVLWVGGAALS